VCWVARANREVAEVVHAFPGVPPAARADPDRIFARAEAHGVAGILWDAWNAAGLPLSEPLASALAAREVARSIEHDAHVAMLARIDAELARCGMDAVALKGPLFARRYYPRPSARGSTDIDLLVMEPQIEGAARALAAVGYVGVDTPEEERFRLEHHHLHFHHAHAPVLELHFHAYRGFGVTLASDTLLVQSERASGFARMRVPSPAAELVYLAVHAASHRFGRLGWLLDMKLICERLTREEIELAAAHARAWGVARVVALAARLLVDVAGVASELVRPLGVLGPTRARLVRSVLVEPEARVRRAATRLVYTTALADSWPNALRQVRDTAMSKARQLVRWRP
jgi:hypothetical protein